MITAEALIKKFQYALDNKWGYIWGTAGIMWTKAKQQQKVDYMVNKYGTSWQKNGEAKADNYYSAAAYGSKWIGHTVADCSGLFAWAFKQLGGAIAHGSNSIYDRYCSSRGRLTDTMKKTLEPGTAVFTGNESTHGHIGLYVGGGKVIEASGTQAGVCVSNISAGKWTYWGKLKDVSYSGEPEVPSGQPTVRRGDKGATVKEMQAMLYNLGYSLGPCGIDGDFGKATEAALKEFQRDHNLTQDGICGPATWWALSDAVSYGEKPNIPRYTVKIVHLSKEQVNELKGKFKDITVTEE